MNEKTIFERFQKMLDADEPVLADIATQAMESALSQEPLSPFSAGDRIRYRVPVIVREPSQYYWQEHRGVILSVNTFAEMVLIQPDDKSETPWRWLWWGYVKRMNDAQE